MNFVGKVLTVLICVMSLVFMTMALMLYATHTNWRDVVMNSKTGYKVKVDGLIADNQNLQDQFERAKKELDNEREIKKANLARLENTLDELRTQRASLEKQLQDLKVSTGEAVATMKKTQDTLHDLRAEVETLRDKIRSAQKERDDAFEEAVQLADLNQQRDIELKRLIGEKTDLAADSTRMRALLQRYGIDPNEDPSTTLPRVSGRVMAVVGGDSVELSIGSDDGLKKGHRLEVFRTRKGQNRYIGRIEIVDTSPDKAVAKVIPEYRKAAIQEGDSVVSKFN